MSFHGHIHTFPPFVFRAKVFFWFFFPARRVHTCPSVAVERQGIVTLTQSRRHSDEVTTPNKLNKTTFCPSAKQNACASREARNWAHMAFALKKQQLLLCKPESRHVNRWQDLALLKKNKKTPLFQCGQVLGSLSYKDWLDSSQNSYSGGGLQKNRKKRRGDDIPLHYNIVQ